VGEYGGEESLINASGSGIIMRGTEEKEEMEEVGINRIDITSGPYAIAIISTPQSLVVCV